MVLQALAQVNTHPYGACMTEKLTKEDWIKAGFRALVSGGPQAIKVEPIARGLKVSKGSFYWHFKDAPALRTSMLEHWMKIATKDVVKTVEAHGFDAKEQLRILIQISTSRASDPYGGRRAEPAIRDWARYDDRAAIVLKSVDMARLQFVHKLFWALGADDAHCTQNATILYGALIGLVALASHGVRDADQNLKALLELLLRDL